MGKAFTVALFLIHLCVPRLCEAAFRQQGAFEVKNSPKHERRESNSHGPSMPIETNEKQPDRFPYMCSILQRGSRSHVCSGFLIRHQWIVTAASCLDPMDFGIGLDPLVYCDTNGKDAVKRDKFFDGKGVMHPMWTGDYRKGFDIALVELDRKQDVVLPKFNKRMLHQSSVRQLNVLGKPKWISGDQLESPTDSMSVSYITTADCRGYAPFRVIDSMICTGTDKKDTLKGDAGGPMLILDRGDRVDEGFADLDFVLGIASGLKTSSKSTLIYTSIAHFWSWIEHVIDGKPISSKELHKPKPFLRSQKQGHLYDDLSGKDLEAVLKTAIAKIEGDNAPGLRKFLTRGLNPDSVSGNDKYTLLHWAARYNSSDCIEVLIEFGANVEAKDWYKRTPLSIAAIYGGLSAAKVLLTHWADIDATDKYQDTPLIWACGVHKWDVAELLINKGANVQAKNNAERTALHIASGYGGVDVVKLLLSKGAEVDAKDDNGETPLYHASYYASSSNVQTVKALLDAGASKTAKAKDGTRPYDAVCKCCTCSDAYRKQWRDLLDPSSSLISEQTSVFPTMLR